MHSAQKAARGEREEDTDRVEPGAGASGDTGERGGLAALPRGHLLAGRTELTLDDLADEPITVNRVGGITHAVTRRPSGSPPG